MLPFTAFVFKRQQTTTTATITTLIHRVFKRNITNDNNKKSFRVQPHNPSLITKNLGCNTKDESNNTLSYTFEEGSSTKNFKTFNNNTVDNDNYGDQYPPMIFVHGGPGSNEDYKYISGALLHLKENPPQSFIDMVRVKGSIRYPTIVRVDVPGYGSSTKLENNTPSAKNLALGIFEGLDVAVITKTESNKHLPFFVVGHSAL